MALTDEQRRRIEENRRRAQARLLERRSGQGAGAGRDKNNASIHGNETQSNRNGGQDAEPCSPVQSGMVSNPGGVSDSETAGSDVAEGQGKRQSMGRSEGTDGDDASSTVASSSLSSGVPKDDGGGGGRGAVRARGTRAGGAGRDDSQGLVGMRGGADGARRGEVVVGAISTKIATCEPCGRNDASVDEELLAGFGVSVCRACKLSREEYQCVTKKEAKEAYLLPEGTIAVLRFVERDNPHHSSWNKMKLYLRRHVIEYSYKRWGGEAGLEAERRKRDALKYERTLARTEGTFKRGKSNNGTAFSSATIYDYDD